MLLFSHNYACFEHVIIEEIFSVNEKIFFFDNFFFNLKIISFRFE